MPAYNTNYPPKPKPHPPYYATSVVKATAIKVARSQNGYDERGENQQKYTAELGWGNGYAWCAAFVAWVMVQIGMPGFAWPHTASSSWGVSWFLGQRRADGGSRLSSQPHVGDWGFKRGGSGPHADDGFPYEHTFLVTGVDGSWLSSSEGNTNLNGSSQGTGSFNRRRQWRGAGTVYRFGSPDYSKAVDPKARPPVRTALYVAHLRYNLDHFKTGKYRGEMAVAKKLLVKAVGANLDPNGIGGPGTDAAIREFQRKIGDKPDAKGKAFLGPIELRKLIADYGSSTATFGG